MIIEIKRDYIIVDGVKEDTESIFRYDRYEDNKPNYVDLRCRPDLCKGHLEFINHSGRYISIIGLNDWRAWLNTRMGITAEKGIMEYMSQYEI